MIREVLWIVGRSYQKYTNDRCPLLASALVNAALFTLFPLMLGLISLSVFIAGSSQPLVDRILPLLKQVIPAGLDEIVRNITAVRHTSIIVAILGMLGFLYGTTSIFGALESSLNHIWKARNDRPFLRKNLMMIGAAFGLWLVLIGSVIMTIVLSAMGIRGLTQYLPLFSFLANTGLFTLVYWRFPNRRVPVLSAFTGAMFTSVFWELVKLLYSWYVTRVVDYTKVFGSLSAIILLLMWFYYSANLFLYGAELSYVHARRKRLRRAAR